MREPQNDKLKAIDVTKAKHNSIITIN